MALSGPETFKKFQIAPEIIKFSSKLSSEMIKKNLKVCKAACESAHA